jgi:hypothetical protein
MKNTGISSSANIPGGAPWEEEQFDVNLCAPTIYNLVTSVEATKAIP